MNILVTGGSKGLGAAIVIRLAANKQNHLFFTYNKSLEASRKLVEENDNISSVYCDYTDSQSVLSLSADLENLGIEVIVNNASVSFPKTHAHSLSVSDFLDRFKVNVLSTLLLTNSAIQVFRKQKKGRIITVLSSSLIGKPPVGWSEYVAQKTYLMSMSKSWAVENSRFNITSNCVSPSFMRTDYNQEVDSRIVEEIISASPVKRLLTTEEVSATVEFLTLCSPYINGQNIIMNAGADL